MYYVSLEYKKKCHINIFFCKALNCRKHEYEFELNKLDDEIINLKKILNNLNKLIPETKSKFKTPVDYKLAALKATITKSKKTIGKTLNNFNILIKKQRYSNRCKQTTS